MLKVIGPLIRGLYPLGNAFVMSTYLLNSTFTEGLLLMKLSELVIEASVLTKSSLGNMILIIASFLNSSYGSRSKLKVFEGILIVVTSVVIEASENVPAIGVVMMSLLTPSTSKP